MLRFQLVRAPAIQDAQHELTGLRGFAALFVVWHHVVIFKYLLDPGYTPQGIAAHFPSGHFQVLVFFVLSGYVIGLTNQRPLTAKTQKTYLQKRIVRLYPVFFLTTGLTLLLTAEHYSLPTILGNALLLQGAVVPAINLIAWAIPYELLYYLLFVVISRLQLPLYAVCSIALLVAFINCAGYNSTHLASLTSYGYGLLFWLAGLWLSKVLASRPLQKTPAGLLLSGVLLLLGSPYFNVIETLLRRVLPQLGVPTTLPANLPWDKIAVSVYDLATIPGAVLLVGLFSGRQILHKPWLAKALVAFGAVQWLLVFRHVQRGEASAEYYALPTVCLAAAALCAFVRSPRLDYLGWCVMRAGSWLGTISYGIYLVHYPLLLGFSRVKVFAGSRSTFAVRLALLLALVLLLGYVLERVVQPYLRSYFLKPVAPPPRAVASH